MTSYSLFLNSSDSTNRDASAGICDIVYNVDWRAIIPKKTNVTRYLMSWSFRTANTTNAMDQTAVVSVRLGQTYAYDQGGSQTTTLGAIVPTGYMFSPTVVRYTYSSEVSDDANIMVGYPSNQQVLVQIRSVEWSGSPAAPVAISNFPGYCLQLFFQELEDE